MLGSILSVGAWTLLSRITGFARDIVMAAVLGAGGLMDVFAVAFRLPNHFRAIFGEGAFNAAFVPAFTRIRTQDGTAAANLFQGRILSLLLISQVIVLLLALLFTPAVIQLLAPGFSANPQKFALAVEVTRITFPYLTLITLVTLWSGALNATGRFAVAAGAPILLNLSLLAFVQLAFLFPTPAHAAGWGVFTAGVLEAGLLAAAAWRAGVLAAPLMPTLSEDVRRFFKAFLPAVIGSAGVQIAMFADTILATLLPEGSASALYFADRIYQLPLGVIAIAAGTVLLPVMSKRIAAEDFAGAYDAQNRTLALTLLLAAPFWVATLLIPELIIGAVFQRGAFQEEAVRVAAQVLAAYGVGLIAAVSIRSIVASFLARGDTATPMIVSLVSVALNVGLKLLLVERFGVMGLALATALGATLNLAALVWIADNRRWIEPDGTFARAVACAGVAAGALAGTILLTYPLIDSWFGGLRFGKEVRLVAHGLTGGIVYGAAALAMMLITGLSLRRGGRASAQRKGA
ncbi:MAG: murein biosynthesis integral membrane protein MurJ [Methylocystis sp.]|nr:murein biosynthesis integral membrane protein MurJ [Methylocystis sp.]MCA3583301.1 murein biosynthesis integral membrane protein MurJ [Methylocystis sp.]MCA3588086.1 murein biosynthesis integral membrane protein MurJ [Methylocystis sp.]MCA3591472.1 murein biosynthesis integral membrane protein MurJ [Methylocystis sp.]